MVKEKNFSILMMILDKFASVKKKESKNLRTRRELDFEIVILKVS